MKLIKCCQIKLSSEIMMNSVVQKAVDQIRIIKVIKNIIITIKIMGRHIRNTIRLLKATIEVIINKLAGKT